VQLGVDASDRVQVAVRAWVPPTSMVAAGARAIEEVRRVSVKASVEV